MRKVYICARQSACTSWPCKNDESTQQHFFFVTLWRITAHSASGRGIRVFRRALRVQMPNVWILEGASCNPRRSIAQIPVVQIARETKISINGTQRRIEAEGTYLIGVEDVDAVRHDTCLQSSVRWSDAMELRSAPYKREKRADLLAKHRGCKRNRTIRYRVHQTANELCTAAV